MAGNKRPQCACGKFYRYDWEKETFYPQCDCKKHFENLEDRG